MRACKHTHVAWCSCAKNVIFNSCKCDLNATQCPCFVLAGKMSNKEIFGLSEQFFVNGGRRLGGVNHSNVKLRALFCEPSIYTGQVFVIRGKQIVGFFKIQLEEMIPKIV